ncbi:MAG: hypothetical protein L0322_18280, partial [Chloroflexi bacterium]|nr:hypothetical protein [Chloroflexota bacterium]
MKRILFALGATLALFVIAYFAWSTWQSGPTVEPGVISNARPTAGPTTEIPATTVPVATPDAATLPAVPSLAGASGLSGGVGGGGEGTAGSTLVFTNPLSGTQYTLNTTLPVEPASAVVYDASNPQRFTQKDAVRLAGLFGLTGPVYTEKFYQEPGSEWTPPIVYQLFDGSRQLAVGDMYFFYYDGAGLPNGVVDPLPFAQSGPIAEAFLQERGLLDFPYQMLSQNGFDVEFRRVVDGRPAIFPEIQVSVNAAGIVWNVSSNPLRAQTALGNYPLRSAGEAWQLLQEQGADFQQVFFTTRPGPDFVLPEPPAGDDLYRYWQREYQDGQIVTLCSYPIAYLPVNGDAAPRIIVEQYLLAGPADQLQALSGYAGKQIYLTGTFRSTDAGKVIELGNWEPMENVVEYTFREGTIARDASQTLLVVSESESYIIPDAPADLNHGEQVYVSGWIDAPAGSTTPSLFNWQGMGILVEEPEQPEILPVDSFIPYQIGQVTIDQVDLVYAVIGTYDESTQTTQFILSPAWRFKGTTDTNELIDIYVQAIP